jgi:threonine synthase
MKQMGLVDCLPKLANVQVSGCAPMVDSFHKGLPMAEPVPKPRTLISTIATGNPGAAYPLLRQLVLQHGGAFVKVADEEAFRAMHVMAKMDGISMESAAATAFAGLFRMVSEGKIASDDVVVVNCSGHTFPVEKFLLGDGWWHNVRAGQDGEVAPQSHEEGLLASLENLDHHVRRVAIIEDNVDSARLLRRVLQSRGDYQIDEARTGRDGLAMMHQHVPDLVLLDLMMPDLDGFGVIDAMKEEPQLRNVPVIVITAKDLTSAERERLERDAHGLWQKGTFLSTDIAEDIDGILS